MIYVSENIFNELSNGKQKIFYSMVRISTLQRLQRIVQERCALEIGERNGSRRALIHLGACMALSSVHGEKQAMRIKIKLVATLCGEVVDIGDSFHGYELESLDY